MCSPGPSSTLEVLGVCYTSTLYWKLCHTVLITISASKIIIVVLFHELIQKMLEGSTLLVSDYLL